MRIAIIGGGITGLTAAYYAVKNIPGSHVYVSEKSTRFGGQLYTHEGIDVGGEAFILRKPHAVDLITQLGLAEHIRYPDPEYRPTVWLHNGLTPLPEGTIMGFPQHASAVQGLSDADISEELATPIAWKLGQDMAVSELASRYCGPQVAQRLIAPLIGGVYAAQCSQLSARYALAPLVAQLDAAAEQGKTITLSEVVRRVLNPNTPKPKGPIFGSLAGGYSTLTQALSDFLHASGRCTFVGEMLSVTPRSHAFVARTARDTLECDATIFTLNPPALARVGSSIVSAPQREVLARIPASSPTVVKVILDGTVDVLPQASGVLIPENNGGRLHAKAVTLSSRKWPHLRPRAIVRLSYGMYPERGAAVSDADYAHYAVSDLQQLGVPSLVRSLSVHRFPNSISVIGPGVPAQLAQIAGELPDNVAFAGPCWEGIGVPACISTAQLAVGKLIAANVF